MASVMYKPIFHITPFLLQLVDEASGLRAWIDSISIRVPWLPLLQREARAKNTHSSTAIEGNPLSLKQKRSFLPKLASGEKIGASQLFELEVINYLKAVHWIEKHAHSQIAEKLVLNLHKILLNNILPAEKCGKYKDKQNYVLNEKGIRIYNPPSPRETPTLTKELIQWINSIEAKSLHPIILCSILHHRLVSIHPFSDGNGRMARALGTWILYQRDYDIHHIFSLDDFFAGDRKRYYQKIEQARELDDDLTYWIEYVAEGIIKTLKDVKIRIENLQITSKHIIALSPRQEEAVRILRDFSPINVNGLKKKLGVSRARINQIIAPLITNGVIIKEGQSRATSYRLAP